MRHRPSFLAFVAPVPWLMLAACGSSAAPSDAVDDDAGARGASSQGSTSPTSLPPIGHSSSSASSTASQGATSTSSQGAIATSSEAGPAPAASDGGATVAVAGLLAAAPDMWTWVPFPDSRCGNGSSTGIGWNPHAGATHLLIYLQGGGACTDADSCWGAEPEASNMTGYSGADFASDPTAEAVIFQRASTGNPFQDANMVFVPYCTGDLHVGTAQVSFTVNGVATPTYFNGANNVDTFAASLAAASATTLARVYLSGASAGGFGSFLNQDAVARAFGAVRVDVIDDSGPAVTGTGIPSAWSARLPPLCTTCVDANSIFLYTRKTYPESRYGLLTFQTDTVLPLFFGETDATFAMLIQQFVTSLEPDLNAKAFVDTSSGHVVLEETDPVAVPFILPWLTQLATDDPAWATVSH